MRPGALPASPTIQAVEAVETIIDTDKVYESERALLCGFHGLLKEIVPRRPFRAAARPSLSVAMCVNLETTPLPLGTLSSSRVHQELRAWAAQAVQPLSPRWGFFYPDVCFRAFNTTPPSDEATAGVLLTFIGELKLRTSWSRGLTQGAIYALQVAELGGGRLGFVGAHHAVSRMAVLSVSVRKLAIEFPPDVLAQLPPMLPLDDLIEKYTLAGALEFDTGEEVNVSALETFWSSAVAAGWQLASRSVSDHSAMGWNPATAAIIALIVSKGREDAQSLHRMHSVSITPTPDTTTPRASSAPPPATSLSSALSSILTLEPGAAIAHAAAGGRLEDVNVPFALAEHMRELHSRDLDLHSVSDSSLVPEELLAPMVRVLGITVYPVTSETMSELYNSLNVGECA